jgi:hypothetical protein
VIINEKGDVVAVVIGVGGFLGIGERRRKGNAEQKRDAVDARFDSEHVDMHIVLNTTKEDLEAAPEFAWLDEQGSNRSQDEQTVR